MSLALASPAPDFTLPTDGAASVTLSALRGRPVVLYFYPKDDTSGCTKQACAFRDQFPDFQGAGATIIGISKDPPASHDRFKGKHSLPFVLASDEDTSVAASYGVWVEKSMYGRTYMGMERATVLIDADGVVRRIWRKVKVAGHATEVLEAVRGL
jgi:peroxiredoxin Q/BCP